MRIELRRPALFLDVGTMMGWAVLREEGPHASGQTSFMPTSGKPPGERWARVGWWLTQMADMEGGEFRTVAYEDPSSIPKSSRQAALVAGGFLAVIEGWCYRKGVPVLAVPVPTIKTALAGKPNATKDAVQQTLKLLGHSFASSDEADALALMEYCLGRSKQMSFEEVADVG